MELTEIVKETGHLHYRMSNDANAMVLRDKKAESDYRICLKILEEQRYRREVVEFYKHVYNSVKTVMNLNEV